MPWNNERYRLEIRSSSIHHRGPRRPGGGSPPRAGRPEATPPGSAGVAREPGGVVSCQGRGPRQVMATGRRSAGSGLGADLGRGLGLLDDLLLEPREHLLILEELHAKAPLALG